MLVDDGGADVGDLAALGQLVDDEGVEVPVVADGDVDDEVLGAEGDEDTDGLVEAGDPVAECLDDLASFVDETRGEGAAKKQLGPVYGAMACRRYVERAKRSLDVSAGLQVSAG